MVKSDSYPRSWMDRFFDWVETLPIPYLLFYLLIYLLIVISQHAMLWSERLVPVGQFASLIFLQNIWFVFIGAFWHFLRRAGDTAIEKFKPALRLPETEFEQVKNRFLYMSPRTAWVITVFGLVLLFFIVPLFQKYYGDLFFSQYTKYSTLLVALLIMPFNLGAFYSTIRMLFAINGLYGQVKRINLFTLTPLYALSAFTSKVGIVFIVFVLLNVVTPYLRDSSATGIETFYTVFNSLFAALVFILPLMGIHRRLETAKAQAVTANNDLIEDGFSKMQALVKAGQHDEVPKLRASNSALLEYRQELGKVSTWPWDTATLRTFATALAVPMTVWVVQQVLLRTLVK